MRTLQWREQLSHEAKWTSQAISFFNEAAQQMEGVEAGALSPRKEQEEPVSFLLLFWEI